MKNADYIPKAFPKRVTWLHNLAIKAPAYAATLGLSANEVLSLQQDNAMYAYVVNYANMMKQTQQYLTAHRNQLDHMDSRQQLGALPVLPALPPPPAPVEGGIFDRVRGLVQRMKNHPNYNDAIGQDLGIIASENTTDVNTIVPELKIRLDVGKPFIKWKRSIAHAIDLYADRNDGNGFVYVGRLLRTGFLDTTPFTADKIADNWKYKAIYVIGNKQVGLMSQPVNVVVVKQ